MKLAQKVEDKPESLPKSEALEAELERLRKKNVDLEKKLYKRDLKKAREQSSESDLGQSESNSTDSKPQQVGEIHAAHPWERKCTTCGGDNENFKAPPNVFCHGPKCNGRIPVGSVDVAEVLKLPKDEKGEVDISGMVKPCTNCGTHDHEVIEPGVVS